MKMKLGFVLSLIMLCCCQCASVLYGYNKVTKVDKAWCTEVAFEENVDSTHLIYLDSIQTINLLDLVCGTNRSIQPMQVHCIKGDSIMSSYFNCYAEGGLGHLNWAFENPSHDLMDGDCLSFDKQMNYQLHDAVSITSGNLMIVVFSSMFKKQSEELIKIAVSRSAGFTLVLVNIDSYYASIFN